MIWIKLNDRVEHRWGIAYRLSDAQLDVFGIAGWYHDEAERDQMFARYDGADVGQAPRLTQLLDEMERLLAGEGGRALYDVRREIEATCRGERLPTK